MTRLRRYLPVLAGLRIPKFCGSAVQETGALKESDLCPVGDLCRNQRTTMPKRMSDGCGGGRAAKPPRRHLYLVLDDWSSGYTVRKIDLSSHAHPAPGRHLAAAVGWEGSIGSFAIDEQVLPSPIFRVEAERGLPMYFAEAFGTKIMAMHPRPRDDQEGLVTAFDVRRRALVFCPRPIPRPKHQDRRHSYPFYIPIGNRLFALTESLQVLNPPNDPSRQCCARSWHKLAQPPFDSNFVSSYAVHPDGRTIFVSIGRLIASATFSFQMAAEGDMEGRWEPLGEWMMPFEGGCHFDAKLNAWVGLSADLDYIGHLIACDVIHARQGQCPSWKFSKETFFSEDPAERHIGATLVYMGHGGRFCLVECVCIEDKHLAGTNKNYREESPVPFHYQFRVSTFALEYDENGDLTAGDSRRIRYYSVPREATFLLLKCPVAFWM